MPKQIPMVDYLVLEDDGPYLVANKCDGCGALFLDRRNACAKCEGRSFSQHRLSNTGKVRSFSIIHRSAPGVPAPFASATIDLDGGGAVKANVVPANGEDPTPDNVKLGMPVELTTYVAGTDDDGTEAICFGFTPTES